MVNIKLCTEVRALMFVVSDLYLLTLADNLYSVLCTHRQEQNTVFSFTKIRYTLPFETSLIYNDYNLYTTKVYM